MEVAQHLLEATSEALLVVDEHGRLTAANEAAAELLGWEGREMVGFSVHRLLHTPGRLEEGSVAGNGISAPEGPASYDEDCPACAALHDGRVHRERTGQFWRRDGVPLPVKYNVQPLGSPGTRKGAVVAFRDRTELLGLQQDLLRLRAIIEETPAFISTADADGRVTYFNKTGRRWLGMDGDEQPQGWRLAPGSRRIARRAAEHGAWRGERQHFLGGRPGAKPDRSVLQTVVAHKDETGAVQFFSTIAVDISEEKRLERERSRLLAIIEESPDFISTADGKGRLLYLNRAGRQWLGVDDDEDISHLTMQDVHPEWAYMVLQDEGLPTAARDGQWHGETAVLHRSGRETPVLQALVAHRDDDGAVQYYSTIARDVTERKRLEERLAYLAAYDALTGVLNRASFQAQLERELSRALKTGTSGALLCFDLDNFKDVNDSFGHHVGDELLQRVADTLRRGLRSRDMLGRFGGDEFAVLLPETGPEDARAIGRRLLDALNEEKVLSGDRTIRLRASVGVAMYPDEAATAADLLIHGDLAMYEAKREGGNRLAVCERPATGRQEARSRLDWEHLCREALENGLFTLHWQPLIDLRGGETVAYELLLRMRGPDGQLYVPGRFLPVCERTEIIYDIDRWVLGQGLDLLADLTAGDGADVRLHINLSGKTFSDGEFLPFVRRRLARSGVDPRGIVLEITETAAIENVDRATGFIKALRQLGFRFALDDFGVGFSTFGSLRRLPVDMLKIDGSFVRNLRRDAVNRHLVKAMVQVARGLDKETVAEFVPDEPTRDMLAELGVDYGQGYFIGRPVPIDLVGARGGG